MLIFGAMRVTHTPEQDGMWAWSRAAQVKPWLRSTGSDKNEETPTNHVRHINEYFEPESPRNYDWRAIEKNVTPSLFVVTT